jgi:hypothetical protein
MTKFGERSDLRTLLELPNQFLGIIYLLGPEFTRHPQSGHAELAIRTNAPINVESIGLAGLSSGALPTSRGGNGEK